jgi:hypothetical protein
MNDVVVHIEVAPDGATVAASLETRDLTLPDSQNDPESPGLAADSHPGVQIDARHEPSGDNFKPTGSFKPIVRGVLKPLMALATAQYVIVTALAGLAAWTIISEAGEAINATLEPLLTALKRL